MHTDFENALLREPVQAILSCIMTYMNHEQRQVLYEKLGRRVAQPPPASAVEEAARMYPFLDRDKFRTENEYDYALSVASLQRQAHITCAGMYTGEIAALKEELSRMWMDYVAIPCRKEGCSEELIDKHWQNFKAKHNL